VIEGPARRFTDAGGTLTIEPQLTLRLLEDIDKGGGSDALPLLLAFTLEQLFLDYRRAGALRLQNYEDFGGLKGAIDAAVERSFVRADSNSRIPKDRKARETLLRRGLIPWLAGIDPDSKAPRRNIARRSEIPDEAAPLIDLLVEERLLSSDTVAVKDASGVEMRVSTIEPAHEALLRQWGLLQGWLEEDFALLATLESVKRAARDWEANARAEAWLGHWGQRARRGAGARCARRYRREARRRGPGVSRGLPREGRGRARRGGGAAAGARRGAGAAAGGCAAAGSSDRRRIGCRARVRGGRLVAMA
jgi:hypothetical protein